MSAAAAPERKVDIVFFEAGSGHRSAAFGLMRALQALRPGWRVRSVDAVDVFSAPARFSWFLRASIDRFNDELRRERVFDLRGKVNLTLLALDMLSAKGLQDIARFWRDDPPDAVVSVTPMYNPALYQAARLASPAVRCVTIPVDFEEFKRRYWFTPRTPAHYLVGTERLEAQALARGVPRRQVERIGGMIIDPAFYDEAALPQEAAQRAGRERLGLDPARQTGLVSFGGQGSVLLAQIARRLAADALPCNLIFLCGRSEAVRAEIAALRTPYRKAALGYTEQAPVHTLQLADFFVGKPGAMTITEALVLGRPLVALKAQGMGPAQAGNEAWLTASGAGVVAPDVDRVPFAVRAVLDSPRYRERAAQLRHRGVFDAAERVRALVEGQVEGPIDD